MQATRRSVTKLSAFALGAVLLLGASPAPRFDDGFQFTMRMSSDPPRGNGPVSITLKVMNEKIRVEMDISSMMGRGGNGAGAMSGGYMLVQPAGKIAVILPSMNMGMSIDAASLGGGRGRGAAPTVDASDVSVSVEDLGPGEAILGHPTHKYRVHETYTQTTTVNGQPTTSKHDATSELWMASDLGSAEKGFRQFGESFASVVGRSTAKQVADAWTSKMPKGFPLKRVQVENTEQGKVTQTQEVTEIKKASFDAADFEVPANIQLMDLGGIMRGRGGR